MLKSSYTYLTEQSSGMEELQKRNSRRIDLFTIMKQPFNDYSYSIYKMHVSTILRTKKSPRGILSCLQRIKSAFLPGPQIDHRCPIFFSAGKKSGVLQEKVCSKNRWIKHAKFLILPLVILYIQRLENILLSILCPRAV